MISSTNIFSRKNKLHWIFLFPLPLKTKITKNKFNMTDSKVRTMASVYNISTTSLLTEKCNSIGHFRVVHLPRPVNGGFVKTTDDFIIDIHNVADQQLSC